MSTLIFQNLIKLWYLISVYYGLLLGLLGYYLRISLLYGFSLKVHPLPGLREFVATESPLKVMKNLFISP